MNGMIISNVHYISGLVKKALMVTPIASQALESFSGHVILEE
jgi:hypothetical protein